MSELAKLIKKRSNIKAQLTRFKTFLDALSAGQEIQIAERLKKCEDLWDTFDTVQSSIESLDSSEIQTNERVSFEDTYFDINSRAKNILEQISVLNSEPTSRVQTNSVNNNTIKLPTIELPHFNGAYDQWITFYDTFRSLIHSNESLSSIQKLYYLKSCLKGEAAEVIRALNVSDNNYEIAWGLLKDRYENKRLIVHNHVKALFELQPIVKESLQPLRKLLDDVKKNLRALKSLGEKVDDWDTLLIYMISSKLDITTKREWEESIISNELPTMERFYEFLAQRCQLLEALQADHQTSKVFNKMSGSDNENLNKSRFNKNTLSGTRSFVTSGSTFLCFLCKEPHSLFRCNQFLELPIKSRMSQVKQLKLCWNCLRSNHTSQECKASGCKFCGKKHNSLLHIDQSAYSDASSTNFQDKPVLTTTSSSNANENQASNFQPVPQQATPMSALHCSHNHSEILLSTALVYILDKHNQPHEVRVLLDSASQSNFITSNLCDVLQLPRQSIDVPIVGINHSMTNTSYMVNATIKSKVNNFSVTMSFLAINQITGNLPVAKINTSSLNIPNNIVLADSDFNIPRQIDLLLGATAFWDLICIGQIRLNHGQPVAQKTKLGWIISGSIPRTIQRKEKRNAETVCNLSTTTIHEQLEKFWLIEECNQRSKQWSREEQECETEFITTSKREANGQFSVRLPVRDNLSEIGDTYQMAKHRFLLLERRFSKDNKLKTQYSEFMKEYLELGHMAEVEMMRHEETEKIMYYLPHHGVYKEDSSTTRLRVVFDASAKSQSGVSLNDKLKVGPTLQDDLFSILIRFRKHQYVIAADIAKMYRQILIQEDQRHLQCILWRENFEQPLKVYQLNTVTYGTASAAYLAIRCLQQVGIENKEQYPEASATILRDFYVDDLLTGAGTLEEAKRIKSDLIQVLSQYGFNLRKWTSNNSEILEDMASEHNNLTHFISDDKTSKTLGLIWNSMEDTLLYSVNSDPLYHRRVTKRVILSTVSKLFDPLGLVGPTIIKAKIILQKIWQLGIDWDEAVPLELHTMWAQFYEQIQSINEIHIPRHVLCVKPVKIQFHCFSDASELAFGGCIYVRTTDMEGQHFVHLLCAKSRIAPLKSITLPRLELCGALLLSKLVFKVIGSISVTVNDIFYYTDSTIVLAWISTEPNQLKTFVSNRIAEIQQLTDISKWRHINSKENPADIISRGVSPEQLTKSDIWWHGPSWLSQDEQRWPQKIKLEPSKELPEKRILHSLPVTVDQNIFDRFSTLTKLQRTIAYCLRFKTNLRTSRALRSTGNLTVEELNQSLMVLIKIAQEQQFAPEIRALKQLNRVDKGSRLLSLNPFLDEENILRVGGRLRKASLHFDNKHQILLPSNHKLTKLIILHEHHKQLHAGPQALLATIRMRFWPIAGRNAVRGILRECITCFRARPMSYKHIMGDLPKARITPSRPFNICGTDYAGPFNIKLNKLRGNQRILKAYLCIFVCFVTKAVHIEIVTDLSTNSFLNCFKRFIARRGKCSHIYSDNGTNYVGAKNDLQEVFNFLRASENQIKISDYLAQDSITWHLIPPRSPHFGGLWESAVKAAKYHFKRVIGNMILTFEELYTLATQVESCLNSRPLTPLTENPDDLNVLTPGHFLIGASLSSLPQQDLQDQNPSRLTRYQHLTQMFQHFWTRWSREYLVNLQQRTKWQFSSSTLFQPGTMVLVIDENLPPLKWQLGRVTEVFVGDDQVIRVASVKTARGIVKRATAKLCPLPFETN